MPNSRGLNWRCPLPPLVRSFTPTRSFLCAYLQSCFTPQPSPSPRWLFFVGHQRLLLFQSRPPPPPRFSSALTELQHRWTDASAAVAVAAATMHLEQNTYICLSVCLSVCQYINLSLYISYTLHMGSLLINFTVSLCVNVETTFWCRIWDSQSVCTWQISTIHAHCIGVIQTGEDYESPSNSFKIYFWIRFLLGNIFSWAHKAE